jgi:hypothetical protein
MARRPLDKTLTYALGVAMTHKAVKILKATSLGAFVGLSLAALEDGFDPFTARGDHCQLYSKTTPRQWITIREEVLGALRAALPDMVSEYCHRVEMQKKRIMSQPDNLKAYREKKKLERNALLKEPVILSEQSYAPGIMQPFKMTRHNPQNSDIKAHQNAKANKNKGIALHD